MDKWDLATEQLRKLALANERDFRRDPALLAAWIANTRNGRHVYTLDHDSPMCGGGAVDCWNTYRELVEIQDPGVLTGRVVAGEGARIRLDCEDAAAALAAALYLAGELGAGVGVKPGEQIGHAIAGVERGGRVVHWFDPAEWAGMAPLAPDGARFLRLH